MKRIGVVPYLNALPLTSYLPPKEIELWVERPSKLTLWMEKKLIDASLLSSVEYYFHKEEWVYHPSLCIASEGRVYSVLLFLSEKDFLWRTPLENLYSLERIYIDSSSRSSFLLLLYLLYKANNEHFHIHFLSPEGILHKIQEKLPQEEGALLIGDRALLLKKYPHYDLGELYSFFTGRGFVFALWSLQKKEEELFSLLERSYQEFLSRKEELLQWAERNFPFSRGFIRRYWEEALVYELRGKMEEDMWWFFEEIEKMKKEEKFLDFLCKGNGRKEESRRLP